MILYVNGDSHSYGHDAGGPDFCYGKILAHRLGAALHLDATAGASNAKIIRTTRDYLKTNTPHAIIIGWSTWERTEWLYGNEYYQFSAGNGLWANWPNEVKEQYKKFVIDRSTDFLNNAFQAHKELWNFYNEIKSHNIPFVFFNCYSNFKHIIAYGKPQYEWGGKYINPYDENFTYYFWLKNQGYQPSNPEFYHYGADGQAAWAEFLLPHLIAELNANARTESEIEANQLRRESHNQEIAGPEDPANNRHALGNGRTDIS
jgi:hypothetical protein